MQVRKIVPTTTEVIWACDHCAATIADIRDGEVRVRGTDMTNRGLVSGWVVAKCPRCRALCGINTEKRHV